MEKAIKLKSVCWNITNICNDNCSFCYRDSESKELHIDQNKIIMDKLIDYGVEKISFVGGEPLLYEQIFELVEYGRKKNRETIFSVTTNALLLFDDSLSINEYIIQKISECFDWITLSLEGADLIQQQIIGRDSNHFFRIIKLLDYFVKNKSAVKIKINTMVCKNNVNSLSNIADLLLRFDVKRWKLMRFLPSRYCAKKNSSQYEISDQEYYSALKKLKMQDELIDKIKITEDFQADYISNYANISPDGKFVSFDGEKYKKAVDLCEGIDDRIYSFIDLGQHLKKRTHFLGL